MVPLDRLSQVHFFQGLPAWALRQFAAAASEKVIEPHEFVVRQHDEANTLLFLLGGSVEFFIHFEGVDDLLVGTSREPGAMIGWSMFRIPHRYTASVRCEEGCRFLEVPVEVFSRVIDQDARVGYLLLKRVARVLADRLEQARYLLTGNSRRESVPTT